MKNFKVIIFILIASVVLSACSWTRLGTLTMMSTRNTDSRLDYVELARYVDSQSKEAKRVLTNTTSESGKNLSLAVDRCVATVAGGEFMKNVQIYVKGNMVKVIGDVWGKPTGYALSVEQQKTEKEKADKAEAELEKEKKAEMRKAEIEEKKQQQLAEQQKLADSFSIGDKVTWSEMGKYLSGEIIGKDSTSAAIKYNDKVGNEKIKKVKFQSLTKIKK